MKFYVDTRITNVTGTAHEISQLEKILTVPDEEGNEYSLFSPESFFYTGLIDRVVSQCNTLGIDHEIEYQFDRPDLDPIEVSKLFLNSILPGKTLYDYQLSAGLKVICRGRGLIIAGTGGGKTEIAAAVTKYLNTKTIMVVDRLTHLGQTHTRFTNYSIDTGRLGGGHDDTDNQCIIATADSLYEGVKRGDPYILGLLNETDLLIMDEVHHLPSTSWSIVAANCNARRRIGLSASAFNDPTALYYNDLVLIGHTGEVVCNIPSRWLINHGYLAEPFIFFHSINSNPIRSWNWGHVYDSGIVHNDLRNMIIAGLAMIASNLGFKVLVLVQRHEHGFNLLRLLNNPEIMFSYGGGKISRFVNGELVQSVADPEQVRLDFDSQKSGILIGSSVYDESVDLPSLNFMIMGGGGKKFRRIVQRIGRPLHSKDDRVYIVDFIDNQHNFLRKHSNDRKYVYDQMEYRYFFGLDELSRCIGYSISIESFIKYYAGSH